MICDRGSSVAERVYRLMLFAYAPTFRQHYGQEMSQAFRQAWQERRQSDGFKALLRFWWLILSDWLRSSLVRYYFAAATGLAFVACWMLFGIANAPNLGPRTSTVACLMSSGTTNADVVATNSRQGPVERKSASAGLCPRQRSGKRQTRGSCGSSFSLRGPSVLAERIASTGGGSKLFRLIGEASIKEARLLDSPKDPSRTRLVVASE